MKNQVMQEWKEMLDYGKIPMFEIELKDGEYLLVDLCLVDNGIEFSFDSGGLDVRFDGEILVLSDNYYVLPFDDCNDLNSMLDMIMDNLSEGFICVNGLYPEDLN